MFTHKNLMTVCAAVVLAFGLAACGSSDDDTAMDEPTVEEPTGPTLEQQLEAAKKALKDKEDADAAKAAAADMKALFGAIDTVAERGTGDTPMGPGDSGSKFKATDTVVGSLGDWAGTEYSMRNAKAVVYSNQGPDTRTPWAKAPHGLTATVGDADVFTVPGDASKSITSDGFPSGAGKVTFPLDTGVTQVTVDGAYAGASGTYFCTGADCAASATTAGVELSGGGGWTFVPDDGAMVVRKDSSYTHFGWWLSTTAAAPSGVDLVHGGGFGADNGLSSDFDDIEGTASYKGYAAGKYAMSSPGEGSYDAGHFVADASLTANFGDENTEGMLSGTIDNFVANDTPRDWSVDLAETTLAAGAVASTAEATWTLASETVADANGTWEAQMHGGGGAKDDGVPTDVSGAFQAGYSTVGSILGAFGATRE